MMYISSQKHRSKKEIYKKKVGEEAKAGESAEEAENRFVLQEAIDNTSTVARDFVSFTLPEIEDYYP